MTIYTSQSEHSCGVLSSNACEISTLYKSMIDVECTTFVLIKSDINLNCDMFKKSHKVKYIILKTWCHHDNHI